MQLCDLDTQTHATWLFCTYIHIRAATYNNLHVQICKLLVLMLNKINF